MKQTHVMRQKWQLTCVFVAAVSCSGCSLFSTEKHQTFADAEGRIPERLMEDLGAGTLGKNWVLANLGKPARQDTINSTTSVYTWALTRTEHRHTQIFLLYRSDKTHNEREFLHVVFNNDEVLKHWLDKDEHVDTQSALSRREVAALGDKDSGPDVATTPSLIVPRAVRPVTTVIRPGAPPSANHSSPPSDSPSEYNL